MKLAHVLVDAKLVSPPVFYAVEALPLQGLQEISGLLATFPPLQACYKLLRAPC